MSASLASHFPALKTVCARLTRLYLNSSGYFPEWHFYGYLSGGKQHGNLEYLKYMNLLLLVVILLLLFGGGGFYFGGPVIGGSGLGLILLICLIIFLAGGFRGRRN
jgi:hypothetical protein